MSEDYLALIKNPKPKSPRVPTSPLQQANQRTERTDNTVRSPTSRNSINLSSLNRPMAQNPNIQPTTIFNQQPLSSRSSKKGSPLNKSSDSIQKAPSFIVEATSQIIYRPAQGGAADNSMLLQSQAIPPRDVRDQEPMRFSQITQRMSTSQMAGSPTFRGENGSMRMSQSSKINVRKPKERKIDYVSVFLGIIVVVLVIVTLKMLFFGKSLKYCDTNVIDTHHDCVPCPPQGQCKNGELIGCDKYYTKHNNQCVEDLQGKLDFTNYKKYISEVLAYKKGEKLCERGNDELTLREIMELLQSKFGEEKLGSFSDFKRGWDLNFVNESEGLIKEKREFREDASEVFTHGDVGGAYSRSYVKLGDVYLTTKPPSPSFSCKLMLLWTRGKLVGLWFCIFIATVIVLVKLGISHSLYSKQAEELYFDVLDYLSYWKKTTVRTLKREFEQKYAGNDYQKLWSYVEGMMRKDGKIHNYFDYYQGEVQEFWMLVD